MRRINCPLCDSEKEETLYKVGHYRLEKCQNCSLIFINPRPNSKEVRKFYDQNYFQSPGKTSYSYENYIRDKKVWQKSFRRRLLRIQKIFNLSLDSKILDVGCATGFFLEVAQKQGFEAEGVEISKWATDVGRKKLGLKIHLGSLETLKVPKRKFDLITMWEVIEHIENLDEFLRAAKKLLKENGKIVLSTPNIQSLDHWLNKEKWGRLDIPVHLFLFSPKTIRDLLTKHNFQILKIETEENFVTFEGMVVSFLKRIFCPRNIHESDKSLFEKTKYRPRERSKRNRSSLFKSLIRSILVIFLLILFPLFKVLFFCNGKGGEMTVYVINKSKKHELS